MDRKERDYIYASIDFHIENEKKVVNKNNFKGGRKR